MHFSTSPSPDPTSPMQFSRYVYICMIPGSHTSLLSSGSFATSAAPSTSAFLLHRRSSSTELVVYTDTDWARCPDTRCSTSGYAVFLGGNLVSWSSKRQPVVSRSNAEAKYRAIANGVAEASWLRQLLAELHSPLSRSALVYCDVGAVYLHQPGPAPENQACGDRSTLHPGSGRHRRCSGPTRPNHLPVHQHLHQGSPVLDLHRVPIQPQHHQWLVASVGGSCVVLLFVFSLQTPLRR